MGKLVTVANILQIVKPGHASTSAYPEQEETSIEHNYSEESCASADSHEVKIQHGNQRVTTMDSEISSEKDIHEHAGGLHISSSAEIGPLEHMTSLLGKWLGVAYTAEGDPVLEAGTRTDECTIEFKQLEAGQQVPGIVDLNQVLCLQMTFVGPEGQVLEGVAELRCPTAKPVKAAAGEVAHVGCEWELLLPLSRSGGKVKGKGKLRVSGNARALWLRNLSFESRFDPFSQEVSEVQPPHHQFGFCKVDDAFHELAQSCTAAEAMEHTLQRAHAPPRGDNLVVRSLWLGEALSPLEHLAVKSWLAHGHEVHVYTYDMELANVPSGALLKDAHSILPNDTAEQPYKHIQTFADLFRYELLKKFGGWWLDLDLPLLRPLDHASPYCFATELEEKTPKVTNCALKCPAQAPLLDYCISQCKEKDNIGQAAWLEIGPVLLHKAVHRYKLQHRTVPPYQFCPLPYAGFLNSFVFPTCVWPTSTTTTDSSGLNEESRTCMTEAHATPVYGVHCYNSLWSFAKDKGFSKECLYEVLKDRFGVPTSGPPVDKNVRLLLHMAHLQSKGQLDLKSMIKSTDSKDQPAADTKTSS